MHATAISCWYRYLWTAAAVASPWSPLVCRAMYQGTALQTELIHCSLPCISAQSRPDLLVEVLQKPRGNVPSELACR